MRPARVIIDLAALRHNYQVAKRLHGGKVFAVIKADAYGHGAVACAKALQGEADAFGVACIEEALELRAAGIQLPILLLEGLFEASELALVCEHRLWFAVATPEQVAMLEHHTVAAPVHVWLKIDSGMHRLGIAPAEAKSMAERLQATGKLASLNWMSHFSRADEPEESTTQQQTECFDQATRGESGESSLSNSAGILAHPRAHRSWGRAGIMLYGSSPFAERSAVELGLRPVMRFESQIISTRQLESGEAIGYGGSFVTDKPMRVGVVACGYADGYPRLAGTGTPIAVNGRLTRLVGRVSMDMLTIDLTDLPDAQVGTPVELWGEQVPVDAIAKRAGTISYELLCHVKRAAFSWQDDTKD
ncbi:alanine racemase [Chitinivorax tropicus]|uniref:Alanine racemase n=1 Tax=Chitinivorax tropicus TaxID=714531 RepID=A0A840MNS4_9PROT|nr:alanine racemase [Chitinivorax tropicus]MBB5018402.1 alanine racemase [Chitinivorax tropicus]